MTLRDPVAKSDGVDFKRNPSGHPDPGLGRFPEGSQVDMPRVDFRPGVDDSDERLVKVLIRQPQGAQEGPVGRPGVSPNQQITSLLHFHSFSSDG
jgi:hypothetical protein